MLENFDRFFSKDPRRIKKVPGSPSAMSLPDEEALMALLAQLEQSSGAANYPLQATFYQKMLDSELLLPVPAGTRLSSGLPIILLENSRGEKGLPLFTSEKNMETWAEEPTDYIVMPFAMLCAYALEAEADFMIMNVCGPFGCEISFHDFSYLAEGLLPPPIDERDATGSRKPSEVVIEKNTPMRLRRNQGLPDGLLERLNHVFEYNRALIQRVYLFDVAFNEGPLQPAIGVRVPDGCESEWEKELWPTLQAILHEMLERRAVMNVFLLNHAGRMESHVKEITQPIFSGVSSDS